VNRIVKKSSGRPVARFGLFGEAAGTGDPEFFHIEDIQSRSRLYRWQITPHTHSRMFQMVWLASGPAEVSADGVQRTVAGPCAICIPGNVVHSFIFDQESQGHVVTVSDIFLQNARSAGSHADGGAVLFEAFLQGPVILPFEEDNAAVSRIDALLVQMTAEFHAMAMGRNEAFIWLLQVMLVLLHRQASEQAVPAGKTGFRRDIFIRFGKLTEEHFRKQWTCERYADALAISAPRLNRICREFSGKTASALVHDRLILEARRHLIYTSAPVELIAYELGFADAGYFNRFFKRMAGVTPGAFRRAREDG
jgi:AraC family transcriptional activator of pobA